MKKLNTTQIYRNACKTLGWSPRKLIEEALKRIDANINPLIVKLPTGYGKTSITLSMGIACHENNANWLRVIHVLPMRSIIDDIESRLRGHIRKLGLTGLKVYKQYMGSPMSPFYCGKDIITTTLDTFIMNLFKVPASEFRKLIELGYSHYDIPRANIYSSAIVFDEFHLLSNIGSLDEERKSLASTLAAIRALSEAGVPIVISTATLPEVLVEAIKNVLKRAGIVVGEQNIIRWGEMKDARFEDSRKSINVSLKIIDEQEVTKILESYTGKKMLFVMNKVKRAVKLFREIRQKFSKTYKKIVLLHGRLTEIMKRERVKEIDEAGIVVATQVIEAGVDKSFDVLITDSCPLDRLIQRAGRVARSEKSSKGYIYVINLKDEEQYSGVYSKELTEDSIKVLKELDEETFSKLEFEETLLEKMEKVYNNYMYPDSLLNHRRLRVLIDLDEQPLIGRNDAKKAIINLEGFTDSFGLVAVFDASEIHKEFSYEVSVGVPEYAAKKILRSERMVIVRNVNNFKMSVEEIVSDMGEFKLVRLGEDVVNKIISSREPLTISLLKYGVEGLAVEKINPVEGLV